MFGTQVSTFLHSSALHHNRLKANLCRFFETEGIAALTMIISRYKVTVKDEPQFAGETFAQKRARVTANKAGVTVT